MISTSSKKVEKSSVKKNNFNLDSKKVGNVKDELELATNWTRVFMNVYQNLKWLNAYATINQIAMQKILKKFVKEHFQLKDNVIDKNLLAFINQKDFAHRNQLQYVIQDLRFFYAQNFTGGNEYNAKLTLEKFNMQMRRKDALIIMFFLGASLIMILFGIFFLCIPQSDGDTDFSDITSATSVLRFTFIIIYIIFASGVAVQIFQMYGVNYLYIFELDPNRKMTNDQLYKTSCVLFFFWSTAFTLTLVQTDLAYVFGDSPPWCLMFLFIFLVVYCFQPFLRCGYRTARF